MTERRSIVRNDRGFALLSALLLLLLVLTLGAAAMLYTLLDVKSTQHYQTGNQAFAAAEAGLLDAINTIDTRGVVNFQNDVVNSGIISTAVTSISGYSNVTYQMSVASGTNTANDGIITATGKAPLSAKRVLNVAVTRGGFSPGAGALHLSNDSAIGTFSGNSMTVDGNNWALPALDASTATLDPSVATRPAISTRSDAVTSEVITALAGQGTITGLGASPSVITTNAASTADTERFVTDILKLNSGGSSAPCSGNNGNNDFWVPGPTGTGVHCVPQTKGNQGNGTQADFWGTLASPQVTYVTDPNARIAGGSTGSGILIFAGNVDFHGSFIFCGWVLFQNPNGNGGINIGGNPTIYGTVWSPLNAFGSGGNITIKYSNTCLNKADAAGLGAANGGNVPHPIQIVSWSES